MLWGADDTVVGTEKDAKSGACIGCSINQYSFQDTCLACPLHSLSTQAANSVAGCRCLSGYERAPDGSCSPCAIGYTGPSGCTRCPTVCCIILLSCTLTSASTLHTNLMSLMRSHQCAAGEHYRRGGVAAPTVLRHDSGEYLSIYPYIHISIYPYIHI
jgi:hypothetical protein